MAEEEAPKEAEAEEQEPAAKDGPTEPPDAAPGPTAGVKRTQQFRMELLKKLPRLTYTSWTVKDNFHIDEEWSTVVNLRADALLGPLEAVAPQHLRS